MSKNQLVSLFSIIAVLFFYTEASSQANNGLNPITIDGKNGLINIKGEVVVEPEFNQIKKSAENLIATQEIEDEKNGDSSIIPEKWLSNRNTSAYIIFLNG